MSVQEVTRTYDCKTPNCDGEAKSSRGPYSRCDRCRANAAPQRHVHVGADRSPSYEQRAKQATRGLAAAGKRLDRAKRRAAEAMAEVRDAQAAWDKALRELTGQAAG